MALLTQIDIKAIILSKSPQFFEQKPRVVGNLIVASLERLIHTRELNAFLAEHGGKMGWEFVAALLDYLDFGYLVAEEHRRLIPATGRLLCVANHTLGPLDGLALLRMIGEVRKDVKIVASDILWEMDNLRDVLLPYDLYSAALQKQHIIQITHALKQEQAVIFFPAGEVAKLTRRGICDAPWRQGPVRLAHKYDAPILPIHVQARHSWVYYIVALLNKDFSTFLLPHESLKHRSQQMRVTIGEPISPRTLADWAADADAQTLALRQHVYRLGNQRHR